MSEWISVLKGLPPKNEVVLIYTPKKYILEAILVMENPLCWMTYEELNTEKRWAIPTHWMPLPAPPKDEKI